MDLFEEVDVIDTKTVNNITYKLVVCRESSVSMKLWVPDYLTRKNWKNEVWKKPLLSVDEKVCRLYQQLKIAHDKELLDVQKQVSIILT